MLGCNGVDDGDALIEDWEEDEGLKFNLLIFNRWSLSEIEFDLLSVFDIAGACNRCAKETLICRSPGLVGPDVSLADCSPPDPLLRPFEMPSSPNEFEAPLAGEFLALVEGGLPLFPPVPLLGRLGPIFSPRKSKIGEGALLLSFVPCPFEHADGFEMSGI